MDQLFVKLGLVKSGMFMRYTEYCVWNRWSKIMFACKTPVLGTYNQSTLLASHNKHQLDIAEKAKGALAHSKNGKVKDEGSQTSKSLNAAISVASGITAGAGKGLGEAAGVVGDWVTLIKGSNVNTNFLNFDTADFTKTPMERFGDLLKDKLLLKGLFRSVGTGWFFLVGRT